MPEIKYCERCGLLLGEVHSARKFCFECREVIDREHRKVYKKAGRIDRSNPPIVLCEHCGKPMQKMHGAQKYHPECKKAAYAKTHQSKPVHGNKGVPRIGVYGKKKADPAVPSVTEVSRMADKMGLSYGQLSLKMRQAK